MKKVIIICEECGTPFDKLKKEHNRSVKLGRKEYCSRKCSGKSPANIKRISKYLGNIETLKGYANNRLDKYTPFRETLKRCKRRKHSCSLTLQDLKEQWELQEGKCIYLGIDLILPNFKKKGRACTLTTASLDRIDSSKPYEVGNIEFIAICMNYMKNDLKKEEFKKILYKVKDLL